MIIGKSIRPELEDLSFMRHLLLLLFIQFLIFALTAVFILLTIGFAQEVEGVQTSWPYLTSTFLYYITSEKIVCDDVIEHLPVTISQNMFVLSSERLYSFLKKKQKFSNFLNELAFRNILRTDGWHNSTQVIRYFKASECREKLFGRLLLKILALVLALIVNLGCLIQVLTLPFFINVN